MNRYNIPLNNGANFSFNLKFLFCYIFIKLYPTGLLVLVITSSRARNFLFVLGVSENGSGQISIKISASYPNYFGIVPPVS